MEALKKELSKLEIPENLKIKVTSKKTQEGGGIKSVKFIKSKGILPPNFLE